MQDHLNLVRAAFFAALFLCTGGWVAGAEFKLTDGTVIVGEVYKIDRESVGIKTAKGYEPARKWEVFSQETLKEFAKDPRAKASVELLLVSADTLEEEKLEPKPRKPKPPFELKSKPSPGRQYAGTGIIAGMTSGGGFLMLLVMYGASIYAAYGVALYRRYPWPMVCGISAVAPVVAPAVFLCMPTRKETAAVDPAAEEFARAVSGAEHPVSAEEHQAIVAAAEEQAAAEAAPAAAVIPPTQVYRRGEFNLNRRFIESKFAGFFRVIPSEADRDLLLVVKSARGEFVGRYIAKATNTEIVFQAFIGDGKVEETIPLNDIFEIEVRHKDAPPQ